ncbi:hypothetical protein [Schlesneria sp.]|uniref:hypothetical protein n=1 Tax=Schlesneria sp. TaxID=2762018 RepID=UPI002EE3D22E
MGRILLPGGNASEVKISLETRKGNSIDNGQAHELTYLDWFAAGNLPSKYPNAKFVNQPCPIYNCHGLTFASRRTQITPDKIQFTKILDEDDYARIDKQDARTGDIILYLESGDYSIEHSGIVIAVTQMEMSTMNIPVIWSKWGKSHEVVHNYYDCPYDSTNVEFFRLKEWKEKK